ncbi:MAG: FixH family protein [Chitinophagales bacterium]
MNWGQKLVLVFIVFAAGMSYLAYRCFHVNTDLVTTEYYKDELHYQDVINGAKSANALSSKIQIIQQKELVTVQLPGEMKNEKVSGNIWFYCAADAKKDRHIPIELNTNASQQIDRKIFMPGIYTVKFDWNSNNKHYYSEEPFTIL